jgi:toxin-antitoxin system PIN domain toxin
MMPCLVDVNVWLALLVAQHEHHRLVRRWFEQLAASQAGLCRVVHLAMIRLLANPAVVGRSAVSAASAWNLMSAILDDERVEFVSEPADLDEIFPTLLNYPVPTGKLVTDAYLAAFAIGTARRLVTLDRGFRQFRGLQVHLLGS